MYFIIIWPYKTPNVITQATGFGLIFEPSLGLITSRADNQKLNCKSGNLVPSQEYVIRYIIKYCRNRMIVNHFWPKRVAVCLYEYNVVSLIAVFICIL
jgi:hypothetical protein